jgi:hypothetical protein
MPRTLAALLSMILCAVVVTSASAATYSETKTTAVPPASNFAGSAGGDGWDVSLSNTEVFNIFHHKTTMTVACHKQSDASACWPLRTITDGIGRNFSSSGQSGTYLDQDTGKLYAFGSRQLDNTGGVVCIDTTTAATQANPFCGFTALTALGDAPYQYAGQGSGIGALQHIGDRLYAFNYASGTVSGDRNRMLCFDLSTMAACAGQPYTVSVGSGSMTMGTDAPGAVARIGTRLIVPSNAGAERLACFDTATNTDCAGSWPVAITGPYWGIRGAAFPLLDAAGAVTGLCLPIGTDPCFDLTGASVSTPSNLASVFTPDNQWNGSAVTIGPRVYRANGNGTDRVECYDYSTSLTCTNFPKTFSNVDLPYVVSPDPQRPTCLWINGDTGTQQIQSFDAYTGGACGQEIRVLTTQYVVPQQECYPTAYESIQVVAPSRSAYTSGTVSFADGAGNPIAGQSNMSLDSAGAADLTGRNLNTASGLPQFIIALTGAGGGVSQLSVKLTWTDAYDPACVSPSTQVDKTSTTTATSLSGGGQSGSSISVPLGTTVTGRSSVSGANAGAATGTVTYTWYSDSSCTTVAASSAKPITTAGTAPDSDPVTPIAPGTYYLVAQYAGDEGNLGSASSCGGSVLTVRSLTPVAPSGLGVSPASPANDNAPKITGTAEAGSTVRVYANASCTGTPVATGTAAAFASPGLTVTVADNSTATFHATATNAAALTSTCSTSSVTYTEQTPGATTPTADETPAANGPAAQTPTPVVLAINAASVRRRCVRSARLLGSPTTGTGGLAFDYTLTADATVRYVIRHRVGSQAWSFCPRAGGNVAARYKTVSDMKRDEQSGKHSTSLATTSSSGRIARRVRTKAGRTHMTFARIAATATLKPGSYSLEMTARGTDGQTTDTTTIRFWVLTNR